LVPLRSKGKANGVPSYGGKEKARCTPLTPAGTLPLVEILIIPWAMAD
jgi:hypothetical protein